MLKCQEVTKIAAAETEHLGFMRRLELKMHLFMCVHCRNYVAQIRALGRDMRGLITGSGPTEKEIRSLEDRICSHLCEDAD